MKTLFLMSIVGLLSLCAMSCQETRPSGSQLLSPGATTAIAVGTVFGEPVINYVVDRWVALPTESLEDRFFGSSFLNTQTQPERYMFQSPTERPYFSDPELGSAGQSPIVDAGEVSNAGEVVATLEEGMEATEAMPELGAFFAAASGAADVDVLEILAVSILEL